MWNKVLSIIGNVLAVVVVGLLVIMLLALTVLALLMACAGIQEVLRCGWNPCQ